MPCFHDRPNKNRYCRECQAAYMRVWRRVSLSREVVVAKREGVESMRSTAIQHFTRYGGIYFEATAVAEILRNLGVD